MRDTVERLIDLMEDGNRPLEVRMAAAAGLGKSGSSRASEALTDVARDGNRPKELRVAAAAAAGEAEGIRKLGGGD